MDKEQERKLRLKEEARKRQLAILKASNQLLMETKEHAMKMEPDELKRESLAMEFDKAVEENKFKSVTYLNSNPEDIEKAEFREVSPKYVEEYKKRLAAKGITDEQMHRKESATVTVGGEKVSTKTRRRHKKAEKDVSEIVRVDNEEELMKMTMVKDEKQIEKQVEKNKQFENKIMQQEHNEKDKAIKKIEEKQNKKKIDKPTEDINRKEVVDNTEQSIRRVSHVSYDFDFSNIPDYVQYDVIPLPSNGECYPHKKGRIAVRYLTASDENIIASPNMYRDNNVIDIILNRCILDKDFKVEELCRGDRDAIVLWLRATAYGVKFPVSVANPNDTSKRYNIDIDLSEFKYREFNLVGDENGLFEYNTQSGDKIKFRLTTNKDDIELRNYMVSENYDINVYHLLENVSTLAELSKMVTFEKEEDNKDFIDCIEDIRDILTENRIEVGNRELYSDTITKQMQVYTVSVNGNANRDFVEHYIENMRSKDAFEYRKFVKENMPGIDFNFQVNIPQSDGGGSFTATFRYDDTIFINV